MHGGNYLVRGSKCALTLHQRRVDSSGLLDAIDESTQMTRGYRGVKGPRVRRWSYALFQVLPLCLGARGGTDYSFLWHVVALKSSGATLHTSFCLFSFTCKMRLVRVLGYSALLCGTAAIVAAPIACAMRRPQGPQSAAPAPSAPPESWHDSLDMLCYAAKVVDRPHRKPNFGSVNQLSTQLKLNTEIDEAAEQEPGCSARARRTQ